MDMFLLYDWELVRSYKWVILDNPGGAIISDGICGDMCVVKSREDGRTLVKAIADSVNKGRRLVIDVQNPEMLELFESIVEKFGSSQYPGRTALVKV